MARIYWYDSKQANYVHLIEMLTKTGMEEKDAKKWIAQNAPKEKAYQRRILDYINTLPGDKFYWKEHSGGFQRAGVPDVCVIYKGVFFGLEVKRPYGLGILTALQKGALEGINKAGGVGRVVSFVDEVEKIIQEATK